MNDLVNEFQQRQWTPPHEDGDASVPRPTIRATKFEPYNASSDSLTRIKEKWLGRLYIKRLKKYPFIRKIAFWLWHNFYPSCTRIIAILRRIKAWYWRPIVKLANYVELSNVPRIKVFDVAMVDTPTPKVIPEEEQGYLVSPHENYEFPPIYVAQLSDAQLYGRTNLIFMQDAVICHDLYDFERDYSSEELHGRHVIDATKKRMRLIRNDATPGHIPVAAAFLDACATNYAHWLTEVLPRIAVFCSVEQYANVPIIVDDGLHPNIMESLAFVVGNDREVIILPIGRAINVGVLYATSVTGYVPFERRPKKLAYHSHGIFSPSAFELVRNRVLPFAKKIPNKDFPKKIYLRRTSKIRKLINSKEIEKHLFDNGFVIVESENLTFLQQVALFSNAESIIAPSGASLANMIFSKPNKNYQILIGKFRLTSYWYWQNIACSCANSVTYIFGKIITRPNVIHSDYKNVIHSDYKVDTSLIKELSDVS